MGIKQDTICTVLSMVSSMKYVFDIYITVVKNIVSVARHLGFKSQFDYLLTGQITLVPLFLLL